MYKGLLPLVLSTVLANTSVSVAVADGVSATPIEFPTESKALIAATLDFFDRVEASEEERDRTPVIGIPLSATRSSAASGPLETDVLTSMGPVKHLTGYRITWYPIDVLYGTVDFMGTWGRNGNLVCGYLSWDLSDPEAPRLDTVTASFVDLGALRNATDSEIHGSLMEANCAFGAIDANFHVFDVSG